MQFTFIPANKKVIERLSKAGDVFEEAAGAFLKASAMIMIEKAVGLAPRDTGTLGNSITASNVKKSHGDIYIEVGTNVAYAPHHEFGTGIYGKNGAPIRPKRAKMLAWKSKSGKMVFARQVKGVRASKFMQQGLDAAKMNAHIAFEAADRIIQGKL